MFDVEAAQERLPGAVQRVGGGDRRGGPQPQRLRVAVAGQAVDGQPDEGALDDGQLAGVVLPLPLAGQPLVHPAPGRRGGGAVAGRLGDGGHGRGRPGFLAVEPELGAVPGGAAARGRLLRGGRGVHDAVAAQPPEDLHGQVAQQPGQPGQVVAGVEDDQDVRVAAVPVPGGRQPGHHAAELARRDLGGVVGRAEADRVQRQGPRGAARPERRDERVWPARDELLVPLPARVAVAEQPLRAGLGVRAQPVAHVGRQPDPAVVPARQRQARQRRPQPPDPDLAAVQRIVQAAVPAPALRLQRQLRQHVHPLQPAGEGVARLEQCIAAQPQRAVQLTPEPRQPRHPAVRLVPVLTPGHNESHQPPSRCLQVLWSEPEDHPTAADTCHHATPDITSNSPQPRQHG